MYKRFFLMLAAVSLLAGCGGGNGSSSDSGSSDQAAQKAWVRAHLDDVYLWFDQIIEVPPANYANAPAYFEALLVDKSIDKFSFSMPQAEADSLLKEGMETGLGVKWGLPARGRLVAYYVDPNSPAAAASITRGTEITSINGRPVSDLTYDDGINPDALSALFPAQPGTSVSLTLRSPGTSTSQTKGLTSRTFSTTTVSQPLILPLTGGGKAGYLLFNQHSLTSEPGLIEALTVFKQEGVAELVLDLRYNTGGYLSIAEEVASMIGGAAVQGQVFEKLLFNSKQTEKTNDPGSTIRFSALDSNGASLPQLGLKRVFVLTGSNTCSASESIINSLTPFIEVVLIGTTTCGKPYGFIQNNYAQQAYFAIQFEGVNAEGRDDYLTGFAPTCQAYEDPNYPLGDTGEVRLKAALYFMDNGACPPAPAVALNKAALASRGPSGEVQLIGQKPGLKLMR